MVVYSLIDICQAGQVSGDCRAPGRTGQVPVWELDTILHMRQGGQSMMRNGDLVRAIDLEGASQAAERLGVTRQRMHQMIDEGKIDYYPMGKRRMVHKRDIDALIMKREAQAS